MLKPKIVDIFREQLRIAFEDRATSFRRSVSAAQSEFSRRGVLNGSAAVFEIGQLFQSELKIRSETALTTLFRVCRDLGLDGSQSEYRELKDLLDAAVEQEFDALGDMLRETPPIRSYGEVQKEYLAMVEEPFRKVKDNQVKKLRTEVDLLEGRMSTLAAQGSVQTGNVAVTGSGNVIQVGNFLQSPMTLRLDAGVRGEIGRALDAVENSIRSLPQSTALPVQDIRGLVAEVRSEIAKEDSNSTKIGSLLSGLAITIQTTASLRPAYDLLKGILAPLGVALP